MRDKDGLWEDPTPPEMFPPSQEAVDAIIKGASRRRLLPNMRPLASVGLIAAVILVSSLGVRLITTTLGDRALSPEEAARLRLERQNAAAQAAPASPEATANPLAAQSSAPAGTPAPTEHLSLPELIADCDAAVTGSFGPQGFAVEQVFKGEAGELLSLPGGDAMRGWALVLLNQDEKGEWAYAHEPAIFRLEQQLLRARTHAGEPLAAYDAAFAPMTMEELRGALSQGDEGP